MMIPNATLDSRDSRIVMLVSVRQRGPFREGAVRKQPPTAHTPSKEGGGGGCDRPFGMAWSTSVRFPTATCSRPSARRLLPPNDVAVDQAAQDQRDEADDRAADPVAPGSVGRNGTPTNGRTKPPTSEMTSHAATSDPKAIPTRRSTRSMTYLSTRLAGDPARAGALRSRADATMSR